MEFSFKKICIEAPFPTTQCGHSCQTVELTTFKDHLYARVFSFRNDSDWIMHISFDLLACTIDYRNELQKEIREKLNNQNIHLITSATHTHYANSVRTPKYLDWLKPVLVDGIASMVYEEVGDVTTSYQRIHCPVVGKSRISGYETNNEFLVLIRFYANGNNILNWVINNCHPTILQAMVPYFSAEYPGYVLKKLEENHSGTNFTFANGAAGDISSRFTRSGQDYEAMCELGDKLVNEVEKLLKEEIAQKPLTLEYKEEDMVYEFDFSPIDTSRIRADLSERELETIKIGQQMRAKYAESEEKTFLGMPLGKQVLSAWNLGSLKLIFFPNEIFSEYLNELDLNNTYLVSYSNGYGPYVLPPHFEYLTYEMFIDTTSENTKQMVKEKIRNF